MVSSPQKTQKFVIESLWLYERALAAASCGIVITDATQPHHPIIYCNPAFEKITGYCREDVIGRNCRFLQGPETDLNVVNQIRYSLKREQEISVIIRNYRKDGVPFWNKLIISPIRDHQGYLTHFIGVQTDITQRQQDQAELQRRNALLKAQQEANPDGCVVIDETGAIVSYNRQFCQMWQIPERLVESANRETLFNAIVPLIAEPLKVFSQIQYLDENPTLIAQDEIQLNTGQVFERYSAPVRSLNGDYYGRIWSFRDITHRKKTEVKLRQKVTREQLLSGMNQRIRQSLNLHEVLNTTVIEVRYFLACDRTVIYRFNPDWTGTILIESLGKEWRSTLGEVIEDQCFSKTQHDFYKNGHIKAIEDIYNADLAPCHIDLLERFQVRANLVVPILQGDNLWGLLIAHQCSKTRKWQDEEIECLRQLGIQLSVAIQQAALFEKLADELRERKAAETALRKSEANLREKTIHLETTLAELKRTQIQLIQNEKMSSLGQLVAGVAHEINNPVTFISGNLKYANDYTQDLLEVVQLYLKQDAHSSPEIADLLEDIDLDFIRDDYPKLLNSMNSGVNRIRAIVESLKNFSRLDEAERKLADIHEGLENTLVILHHRLKTETSSIEIIREYTILPLVECYPGQLNQVFMYLINNAIDAIEESAAKNKGKLTIRTERSNQDSVVIRIADNGSGITSEIQEKIFDPFFTTKPIGKGTGLGLSISYQIVVEKHEGQLYYISEPGQGTEFIIEIPMQQFS